MNEPVSDRQEILENIKTSGAKLGLKEIAELGTDVTHGH